MRRFEQTYLELTHLADGVEVILRFLTPEDAPLLQAGLAGLSERSRYFRFHGVKTELSPEELRALTNVDGENHLALAVFTVKPMELAAVGRFVRGPRALDEAEVALTVRDAVQGRGLGELLLSRLRAAALERGIERFTGSVLSQNRAMVGLLRKLDARIGLSSLGVREFELELALAGQPNCWKSGSGSSVGKHSDQIAARRS
ncbi:MAG TPA: GNAT family N-acetyltransferase [Myxococcales bacterium]|jgi:GNAT superfamily N-acetyltransferase|nr:GNAT family N-acetyltransferase [Myxococcales bacterium]